MESFENSHEYLKDNKLYLMKVNFSSQAETHKGKTAKYP